MGEHEPTATVPAQSISAQNTSAQNTSEQATSAQPRTVAPTVRPAPPKIPRPVPAPRVDSPLISAIIAEAVSPEELNARILEVVSEGTPIIEPCTAKTAASVRTSESSPFCTTTSRRSRCSCSSTA